MTTIQLDPGGDSHITRLSPANRRINAVFNEAQFAARKVSNRARCLGQIPTLCLSGGVDSEVMARAFLASGIPFEVAIMRFHNNWNDFDICSAIEFCEKENITYRFYDLDVEEFFASKKYLEYGEKYQCQSPQLACHLWLCDQIEGFPVLGGNPLLPKFKRIPTDLKNESYIDPESFKLFGVPGDLHSVFFRYSARSYKQLEPFFLMSTPELIYSFWFLSSFINTTHKVTFFDEEYTYLDKCEIYQQAGFDIEPREDKFTGFEKLKDHFDKIDGKKYGHGFNDRYRKPLEEMNPLRTSLLDAQLPENVRDIYSRLTLSKKQLNDSTSRRFFVKAASFFGLNMLLPEISVNLFAPRKAEAACSPATFCISPADCGATSPASPFSPCAQTCGPKNSCI